MNKSTNQEHTPFLNHIHYFRAFAILNIFLTHVWVVAESFEHEPSRWVVDVFNKVSFHGATLYFVFISGFLFYYLSRKINIRKYYTSKITNVILPYVIVSIVITVSGMGDAKSLHDIERILLHGKAQYHLWFIPVICGFFLISPLLLLIPRSFLGIVAVASCILPMIFPRTHIWITVNQYLYFLPAYLLGIWAASDYPKALGVMRRYANCLGLLLILSTATLLYIAIELDWRRWLDLTERLFFIQKISLCFLILPFLSKFESYKFPLISKIATYSFSIYFLHNIIVHHWWVNDVYAMLPAANSLMGVGVSLAFAIVKFGLVLGICMGLKTLFGKYSRMVIGS